METNDVVNILSSIPIGTLIAWCIVISGIIVAIVTSTMKLYKIFEKTHEIKEENAEFKELIRKHEEQLNNIAETLNVIQNKLNKHEEANIKRMRYSLVRAGEEYVSIGEITIRQLKSLEEMFEEYHEHHGNGYVTTLMRKVRALPIIGKLDENDNDIE